jgi:hypothetical protein
MPVSDTEQRQCQGKASTEQSLKYACNWSEAVCRKLAQNGLQLIARSATEAPTCDILEPYSFGQDFALPVFKPTRLQFLNLHSRDHRVVFTASGHVYTIDGQRTLGSVTGLVHAFAAQFDEDAIISQMMCGNKWPRPGYLRQHPASDSLAALRNVPNGVVWLSLLLADPRDEDAIASHARLLLATVPGLTTAVLSLALDEDEIKQKWEINRVQAASRGTWMHYTFELFLNGYPMYRTPEAQLFWRFLSTLHGLSSYRTEWEIFGEEERLAGSIDFVAKAECGSFVIIDWKRTARLRTKYSNKFQSMFAPLQHLQDCAGTHYRLQLNCYRYIIQKYYGMVVSRMLVVGAHSDNGDAAFVDEVPVMRAETEDLMNWQRARAKSAECA